MQHVGRKYARHRATPTHAQVTSASKQNADKQKTPIKPLKYGDFRVPSGPLERKRKTSNTFEEVKKGDDRNDQKNQEEAGPLTRNRSARKLTKIPRTDAGTRDEPVNSVESVKQRPGRPNVGKIKEKEPVKSIEPVKRGRRKPRVEKVKEIEPVAVVTPTKIDESLGNNLVQKVRSKVYILNALDVIMNNFKTAILYDVFFRKRRMVGALYLEARKIVNQQVQSAKIRNRLDRRIESLPICR